MKLDRRYVEKVVRHELGHWFVAQTLGFVTGDIEIKIYVSTEGATLSHKGSSHIDLCPRLTSTDEITDYIVDRATVLYAGTAFQSVVDERQFIAILESDGSDDNSKLTELCFLWRGIKFPDDTRQKNELKQRRVFTDQCWDKAVKIHNDNGDLIDEVAKHITDKIIIPNKKYVFKKVELLKLLVS